MNFQRFTIINVSHRNEKRRYPARTDTCRVVSIPLLFRSVSLTFVLLYDHCARNRVYQSVSKTHPCSCHSNDRSRKITRNLHNSDCKAIEDSDCSVSRSSNVGPTTSARVQSSSRSSMVRRNCPGSHIHRRTSTKPTSVNPVVLLSRCSRCTPQDLSCRVISVSDHKAPSRKSRVSV